MCVCNSLYKVQNKPVFNVSYIPTLFIVFHIFSRPWLCWLYLSPTVLYGDKVSEGGREKFDTGPHDLGRRPAVKAEDCPRCCIQTEEHLFILSVAISLLYIHLRKKNMKTLFFGTYEVESWTERSLTCFSCSPSSGSCCCLIFVSPWASCVKFPHSPHSPWGMRKLKVMGNW